jgi:hypothetical protein
MYTNLTKLEDVIIETTDSKLKGKLNALNNFKNIEISTPEPKEINISDIIYISVNIKAHRNKSIDSIREGKLYITEIRILKKILAILMTLKLLRRS